VVIAVDQANPGARPAEHGARPFSSSPRQRRAPERPRRWIDLILLIRLMILLLSLYQVAIGG
jgi:hypothetical protein